MHTITTAVLILIATAANAQTSFVRVVSNTTNTHYLTIAPNTLASHVSTTPGILSMSVDYGFGFSTYNSDLTTQPSGPILGPAVLRVTTQQNAVNVIKLETVNTTPAAALVAPAGSSAVLTVQTSTNLTDWHTITNAAFPKSEANRFFRASLLVQ